MDEWVVVVVVWPFHNVCFFRSLREAKMLDRHWGRGHFTLSSWERGDTLVERGGVMGKMG
jgi:hypothetical protein